MACSLFFYRLCEMIDKPSMGLDKWFFALGNAILLHCKPQKRNNNH